MWRGFISQTFGEGWLVNESPKLTATRKKRQEQIKNPDPWWTHGEQG